MPIGKMPMLSSLGILIWLGMKQRESEMSSKEITPEERLAYRTAARVWLDLSAVATQDLPVECSFLGAYCYAMGVPVTIYNCSKLFVNGSYRTTKRYVDLMVEVGALEYTDTGMVVVTEKGNETSDWYFQRMFEMPSQVRKLEPAVKTCEVCDSLVEDDRSVVQLSAASKK